MPVTAKRGAALRPQVLARLHRQDSLPAAQQSERLRGARGGGAGQRARLHRLRAGAADRARTASRSGSPRPAPWSWASAPTAGSRCGKACRPASGWCAAAPSAGGRHADPVQGRPQVTWGRPPGLPMSFSFSFSFSFSASCSYVSDQAVQRGEGEEGRERERAEVATRKRLCPSSCSARSTPRASNFNSSATCTRPASTTLAIDAGVLGPPHFRAGHCRASEVFAAAGTTLAAVVQAGDRGQAVEAAARGAAKIVAGPARPGQGRRRPRPGRLGGHHHRHRRHAGPAVRRAQAHGQHARQRPGQALRRRPRHPDDALRRRHQRPQSHQPHRAAPTPPTRWSAWCGTQVDQARRPANDKPLITATMFGVTTPCVEAAPAAAGAGRLRGARLSRHRHRRHDDGVVHRATA